MAKNDKIERIYNIPLRKGFQKAPLYRRSKKAIAELKEFLARHMRCDAKDLKIGKHLNEEVWKNGIKNPPHHVKVTVFKDESGIVKAELFGHKYEEATAEVKEEKPKASEKKPEAKAEEKTSEKKEETAEAPIKEDKPKEEKPKASKKKPEAKKPSEKKSEKPAKAETKPKKAPAKKSSPKPKSAEKKD